MSETTLDRIVNVCLAVGAMGLTIMTLALIGVFLWFIVKEGRRVFRP